MLTLLPATWLFADGAAVADGAGLCLRALSAAPAGRHSPGRTALWRGTRRPDELGQLAATINTMGEDIHQMLEAKRALLLAMSHELRSPLTRARLNTELLPEGADTQAQRDALLRDLGEMARLISDLLESERLAGRHAALHREPTDLAALAREVVEELSVRHAAAAHIRVVMNGAGLAGKPTEGRPPQHPTPLMALDRSRVRLLLRNLLDNSLRHSDPAAPPPELHCTLDATGGVVLRVRDFGPGVADEHLGRAGAPLGAWAWAHGGWLHIANAKPGLEVWIPVDLQPAESASVEFVHGDVKALPPTPHAKAGNAATANAPLAAGSTLAEGTKLEVGPDAFIAVRLADGSIVRVNAQSDVQLRQLRRRGRVRARRSGRCKPCR
eukprot:gene45848-57145_t